MKNLIKPKTEGPQDPDIGALIGTIGFWGILCYIYNKEPRQ